MVHTRSGAGCEPIPSGFINKLPSAFTCCVCLGSVPFVFAGMCVAGHPTCMGCTFRIMEEAVAGGNPVRCPVCRDETAVPTWAVAFGPRYLERLSIFVARQSTHAETTG